MKTTSSNFLLWQPTEQAIAKTAMFHFMEQVNQKHHLQLKDYKNLYQWSIQYPELFWPAVWEFCDIKASKKWHKVLVPGKQMQETQWFEGAKLNFAENLLRHRDDKLALVFHGEKAKRQTLTYKELYQQTSQIAAALKNSTVMSNDRIAGLLPNIPETVIAMLAATSQGAVWSSCSPDFGVEGVLERFSQIQPKVLFTVDGYFYNGKVYDISEKVIALCQQIPELQQIIVIPFVDEKATSQLIHALTKKCPQLKVTAWQPFIDSPSAST